MRSRLFMIALIGAIALCASGCSVSRQALRSEVSSQTSSAIRDTVREEVLVAVHDTLREVTTITIQQNEAGDTVKQSIVTDRYRGRNAEGMKVHDERLTVQRDTVYVEKRDSILVKDSGFRVQASGEKKSGFLTYVKRIFALICAVIVLIITVKVCMRRSLL